MKNARRSSIGGVLRCLICGGEQARVPCGLNYGFPKCCGQTMRVITPHELKEEQDFANTFEDEERFRAALDS